MTEQNEIPIEYFEAGLWEKLFDVLEGSKGSKSNLLDYISCFKADDLPPHAKIMKKILKDKKRSDKTPVAVRVSEGAQIRTLYNVLKAGKERICFNADLKHGYETIPAKKPIQPANVATAVGMVFGKSQSYVTKVTAREHKATARLSEEKYGMRRLKIKGKAEDKHTRNLVKQYLDDHPGTIYLPIKFEKIQKTDLFKFLSEPLSIGF